MMARGGIVPVPGFPGERANSSVIPMIEFIAKRFGLTLTDAFGSGHQSPGHTVTGTAADFSGADARMDAAVRYLVGQGYLVGYDGRFGSQNWPGHGPSTRTSNFHLHVELGGKGGGAPVINAKPIKRVKVRGDMGGVSGMAQGAVDTLRKAGQARVSKIANAVYSAPVAGGGGGYSGAKKGYLKKLWVAAGGPPNQANLMAAIALAESGGNQFAHNPSGASGYWQILGQMVPGNIYNPMVNAKNAVAKYRAQGLGAWEAYTKGMHRQFLSMGGFVRAQRGFDTAAPRGVRSKPQKTTHKNRPATRPKAAAPTLTRGSVGLGANAVPKAPRKNPKSGPANKMSRRKFTGALNRAVQSHGRVVKLQKIEHPWVNQVNYLKDQQQLWQGEVSYREGKVEEPEDFLIEKHDDPNDKTLITGYEIDTAAVSTYKGQLSGVFGAVQTLRTVISRLVAAIPNAFQELTNEMGSRSNNILTLQTAISQQEMQLKTLQNHNKKGKNNAEIKRTSDRLNRYRDQLRKEKEERGAAKEDRKQLSPDYQQALLDQRDINDDFTEYTNRIRALDLQDPTSTPNTALAEANAGLNPSDTAAAGGGSTPGDVTAAFADVIRTYGGNTGVNLGRQAAGSSGGGAMQANPAGFNSHIGAFVAGASAAGAAAQVIQSGGAAGRAIQGAAASIVSGSAGASAPVAAAGPATVNVTNNFTAPPADPHTWSKGVAFELGNIV